MAPIESTRTGEQAGSYSGMKQALEETAAKEYSLDGRQAKVIVKDLRKCFGHLDVLRGIDMAAYESDVICVIGPSGSGKSTFLRCLNMLENQRPVR